MNWREGEKKLVVRVAVAFEGKGRSVLKGIMTVCTMQIVSFIYLLPWIIHECISNLVNELLKLSWSTMLLILLCLNATVFIQHHSLSREGI